jgi:Ca-activated chloride channel family protein
MNESPNPSAAAIPSATLVLSPICAAYPQAGGTLDVLVRMKAPARPAEDPFAPTARRVPLRLALVVDRSGSMDGAPLTEALRCVNHIAARLQPVDHLAVVLYDNHVLTPVPLRPVASAAAVAAALAGVESGGNTDLFAGWEQGARQLESAQAQVLSRVILLSDGQANHGLVDPAEIQQHCARWLAEKGISTTTVGLGRGFNEDLMVGMARAGGGQQYYGQTAEDLFDGFDEELALLQALCLRQLRIKLIAGAGVIAEPLGLVRQNPDQTFTLSDLAWGAESWLLVRLHIAGMVSNDAALPVVGMDQRALLSVALQAERLDGSPVAIASPVLALPGLDAKALEALPKDELVAQRLLEVQFGETGAQVRERLGQGDHKGAEKLLERMEAGAIGHPWLEEKVQRLRDLARRDAVMAQKELHYSRYRMASRLSSDEVVLRYADETAASEKPSFLRRKSSEGKGRKS